MTFAQVVETSVTSNSTLQDYSHLDEHTIRSTNLLPFDNFKLEDAKQEGQDQEKKDENPQQQIPDEENGIEMSENFEGALHDVEAGDEEEENEKSGDENEDEADIDKKMGGVDGQDTEKLDEKMWGDSDDEDEKEVKEKAKINFEIFARKRIFFCCLKLISQTLDFSELLIPRIKVISIP